MVSDDDDDEEEEEEKKMMMTELGFELRQSEEILQTGR